ALHLPAGAGRLRFFLGRSLVAKRPVAGASGYDGTEGTSVAERDGSQSEGSAIMEWRARRFDRTA
ncbi:MAG TPA: hypothetical protein VNC50_14510, partial [Planctomycetia bacterium]|nr:hypothetical protein [Planctomycetia bacterium]HVJ82277.1 hypothetical protein [Planctomycetia bacterium]